MLVAFLIQGGDTLILICLLSQFTLICVAFIVCSRDASRVSKRHGFMILQPHKNVMTFCNRKFMDF